MSGYIFSTQHREWIRLNSNYDNHLVHSEKQKDIRQLTDQEIEALMRTAR